MVVDSTLKGKGKSQKSAPIQQITAGKIETAKGQLSIASFFAKKPTPSTDTGTPLHIETNPAVSLESCETAHKKNLQPCFEEVHSVESALDVEHECAPKKSGVSGNNTPATVEANEEDCIVVSDSTATEGKPPILKKSEHSLKKKPSTSAPASSLNRETKTKKLAPTVPTQQNTLCFSANIDSAKVPVKHKTSRPPHPEGIPLCYESDKLMIAEFSAKFRKFLGLENNISLRDLDNWFNSKKTPPQSNVATFHRKILSLIIRDGETPDEDRLLDEDTWPEVMRQHLEDTYRDNKDYIVLVDQLTLNEYCDIPPSLRLQALTTLVNDCLQTKTLRTQLDLSVEVVDDLKKQQQVEGLQDKYRKLDVETIPHIPFVPSSVSNTEPEEPESIPEGLTERQRLKLKAKQGEEKKRHEEELRREQEYRRHAEEDARRLEQEQKRERSEQRARDLIEHSQLIRAKKHVSPDPNHWRQYLILQCFGERRRVFVESRNQEVGEEGKWAIMSRKEDTDTILAHYNPSVVGEKERGNHKLLRELIMDADYDLDPEADTQTTTITDADSHVQDEEDFVDVYSHARIVVLDMEECTPDDLFSDHEDYKRRRQAWIDGVAEAKNPKELCASVLSFEREMRRSKMLEGWDEVRAKWLQDLASVVTSSVLLYLVKQLRVYLGRQKPKAGKLAAIFAGPMRMTRSQARIADKASGGREKRKRDEAEDDAEMEEDSPVPRRAAARGGPCAAASDHASARVTRSRVREAHGPAVPSESGSRRSAGSNERSSDEGDAAGSSGDSQVGDSDSDFQVEDSDDGRHNLRSRPAATPRRPAPHQPARSKPPSGDSARRPTRAAASAAGRAGAAPPTRRSGRSAGQAGGPRYRFDDSGASDSD